jgi:hypothetical protein
MTPDRSASHQALGFDHAIRVTLEPLARATRELFHAFGVVLGELDMREPEQRASLERGVAELVEHGRGLAQRSSHGGDVVRQQRLELRQIKQRLGERSSSTGTCLCDVLPRCSQRHFVEGIT